MSAPLETSAFNVLCNLQHLVEFDADQAEVYGAVNSALDLERIRP
ncbi:MAG: hypothetical protein AAGC70_05965 [Pseudomonadota bacterium]